MALLPNIRPDQVYTGWWQNHTVPGYRQYLWTTTNGKALFFLGILGVLGSFAGERSWPIIRYLLQPAVQLSDCENIRVKISRSDAIKALWREWKDVKEVMKTVWVKEHELWQKIRLSMGTFRGTYRPTLRLQSPTIESRFGIYAVLNIISFVLQTILVPFLLAEGLQGQAVVQATERFRGNPFSTREDAMVDEEVRDRASRDYETCVTVRGDWMHTDHCIALRKSLPTYKVENMSWDDPTFATPPYKFLSERGDANFNAIRMSQNTTLQDVAVNTKPGGPKSFHELTCVPVAIDPLITRVNKCFNLKVPDLVPLLPPSLSKIYSYRIHDARVLKTSNVIKSWTDEQLFGSDCDDDFCCSMERNKNYEEIWIRTIVDAPLPYLEFKGPEADILTRSALVATLIDGDHRSRIRNFLITYNSLRFFTTIPKDTVEDPIFGMHQYGKMGMSLDREVTALGCTEVFKTCVEHQYTEQCTEFPVDSDFWIQRSFMGAMSVWWGAMIDPLYGYGSGGRIRNSHRKWSNDRQRWQDDVKERFIRSMLRVQHTSKFAAEQDLLVRQISTFMPEHGTNWTYYTKVQPLLYLNPNFTNINILGVFATSIGYLYIIAASYWFVLLSPFLLPVKIATCIGSLRLYWLEASGFFRQTAAHRSHYNASNSRGPGRVSSQERIISSDTLTLNVLHVPQDGHLSSGLSPQEPTGTSRSA